jgi:hypothetical protein
MPSHGDTGTPPRRCLPGGERSRGPQPDTANAAVSLLPGSEYGIMHHNCEGILLRRRSPMTERRPAPTVSDFALRILS